MAPEDCDQSRDEDRGRLVSRAFHRLEKAAARLDPQSSEAVILAVKAALHKAIPPHGFTVIQTLCQQNRTKVFNELGAKVFPDNHSQFIATIRKAVVDSGFASRRKAQRIAENAWSCNDAADRRTRAGDESPYRGRPEIYNPEVVKAIADAIAHAVGEERFRWYHGEKTTTITDSAQAGPMVDIVCCAVAWAMLVAWQASAPPDTEPPKLKPEGILSILRRTTRTKRAALEARETRSANERVRGIWLQFSAWRIMRLVWRKSSGCGDGSARTTRTKHTD
jgi:hypothetical protein